MYRIITMHEITNMVTIIYTSSGSQLRIRNSLTIKELPAFSIIELFHMVGENEHLHRR